MSDDLEVDDNKRNMASNLFKRQRLRLPNTGAYYQTNVQSIPATPIDNKRAINKTVTVFSSGIITVRRSAEKEISKSQKPVSMATMNLKVHATGLVEKKPPEKLKISPEIKEIKRRSMTDIINIPAGRLRARMRESALAAVAEETEINNNIIEQPVAKGNTKKAALEEERVQAEERARLSSQPVSLATCVCDRPKTTIVCRACGFTAWGRVRKQCVLHCRVSYLLDIDRCPGCNRRAIVEEQPLAED